eukprot:TRINITY_DN3345_c1_g1_i2.p1 TRINITY_DN3345_c1_g1~~TRINITY_DN3345_c1_g1_i2.p1  ORF type:complete len:577 (+),score=101.51 TRINITY_DN3345_c1_g1_i2:88-1818(+)
MNLSLRPVAAPPTAAPPAAAGAAGSDICRQWSDALALRRAGTQAPREPGGGSPGEGPPDGCVRRTLHLAAPSEPIGLTFTVKEKGLLLGEPTAAAAAADVPAGAWLRCIDGTPCRTAADVQTAVRRIRGKGKLSFSVDIQLPRRTAQLKRGLSARAASRELSSAMTPSATMQGEQLSGAAEPRADAAPEPSAASAAPTAPPGERVPAMPLLLPHRDESARLLIQKLIKDSGPLTAPTSFPADIDFWDNLVAEVALCDGARAAPLVALRASHDASSYVEANLDWVRAFVEAWKTRNPHCVTVTSGRRQLSQFWATPAFWEGIVEPLRCAPPPANKGDCVEVATSTAPNAPPSRPPVKVAAAEWAAACARWEAEQGLGAQQGHTAQEVGPSPPPAPAVRAPCGGSPAGSADAGGRRGPEASPAPAQAPAASAPPFFSVDAVEAPSPSSERRESAASRHRAVSTPQSTPPLQPLPLPSPLPPPPLLSRGMSSAAGGRCTGPHQVKPSRNLSPPRTAPAGPARHAAGLPARRSSELAAAQQAVAESWRSFVLGWESVADDLQRTGATATLLAPLGGGLEL